MEGLHTFLEKRGNGAADSVADSLETQRGHSTGRKGITGRDHRVRIRMRGAQIEVKVRYEEWSEEDVGGLNLGM